MKKGIMFFTATLFAFGLSNAFTQEPQKQTNEVFIYQSPDGPSISAAVKDQVFGIGTRITGIGPNVLFMGGQIMLDGKRVTGAPYSAEAVTETVQTLADGNRITQQSTSKVYRDSEGRTRRETEGNDLPPGPLFFRSFGPAGAAGMAQGSETVVATASAGSAAGTVAGGPGAPGEPVIFYARILISDPVAGVNYMLDPTTHTAQKMSVSTVPMQDPAIAAAVAKARQQVEATGQASVTVNEADNKVMIRMKRRTEGGPVPAPATESLGTRVIEGVECDGMRTTTTIPAGQIGNELPIVITSEHWYSPELQTEVLSKHHDPRNGDTTFKQVGIDRSEPPASLFQVPSDYTIVDIAEKAKALIQEKDANNNK